MISAGKAMIVFIMMLSLSVSACGSEKSKDTNKKQNLGENMPAAINALDLKSAAFESGEMIPEKYSCDGENISPQLSWNKAPEKTAEFVLICDDPDAPMGTFVHWVAYGIPPATTSLPDNVPNSDTTMALRQGKNSSGKIGYRGPCPPRGSTHRYFFKLYAIDKSVDLKPGAGKEAVMKAIDGHILARGELIGRYGR